MLQTCFFLGVDVVAGHGVEDGVVECDVGESCGEEEGSGMYREFEN